MKPAPFVQHEARSQDHAISLLAELAQQGGRILAGGQSLAPIMVLRLAQPTHLIDINCILNLDHVRAQDEMPVEARLILLPDDSCSGLYDHSRRAGNDAPAMSLVSFSVLRGRMQTVRLGVGGAEPNPSRLTKVGVLLGDETSGAGLFSHAPDIAAHQVAALEEGQVRLLSPIMGCNAASARWAS